MIPRDLDRALDGLIKSGFAGNKAELARTALTHFLTTIPSQLIKGYDLETAFSPDGRIFQLEYSMESMKRGATMVGISYDHGIVLAKEAPSEYRNLLILPNPFYRIFRAAETTAIAFCGIQQDCLLVFEEAKRQAEALKKEDNTPNVEAFAREIALFMQPFSQRKDLRPLAVAMIIGGLDSQGKPRLFLINSAGVSQEFKACMEGIGGDETRGILKDGYKANMSLKEATVLAIKATLRSKRTPEDIMVSTLDSRTKKVRDMRLEKKQELLKIAFP